MRLLGRTAQLIDRLSRETTREVLQKLGTLVSSDEL